MSDECPDKSTDCPYQDDFGYNRSQLENIGRDVKEIKDGVKSLNGRLNKAELNIARIIAVGSVLVWLIPVIVKLVWK